METNSHCYSSERLALDHFDLLELLRVHNAHEGQTCQAATGVVFLPFNDGKVTLDGRRIRERCCQSIAQLTQLHEAPLQAVPRLVNRWTTNAHGYYSECALDDPLKSDDFSLVTPRWETTKMTAPKSLFWPS